MQLPLHALSQQKPSAQNPDAHWTFCVQRAGPGLMGQRPSMQGLPSQSVSVTQLVRHAPAPGSQAYGTQIIVAPSWHVPKPLQAFWPTTAARPLHDPGAQGVPAAWKRQVPPPLQVPS
jgi:hypothetical protein